MKYYENTKHIIVREVSFVPYRPVRLVFTFPVPWRYRNKVVSCWKIYQPIAGHFGHTGEDIEFRPVNAYRTGTKKTVSFSLSPSTDDDLYILNLKSVSWTDFGCCYILTLIFIFVFIFIFFSSSLSLSPSV